MSASQPMDIPKELQRNPHFARYFRTWQKNELSIVFIPLAQICREQGFLDMAQEICEKGLSRHPASVSGRLMLARILMDQEDLEGARAIVAKVLEEYPAQQEAVALEDRIRRISGEDVPPPAAAANEPAKAEDADDETTEIAPPPTTSLWENPTMAKIYADQGETRLARQILERILARDPANIRASELKKVLSA